MRKLQGVNNRTSRGQRRLFLGILTASALGLMAWALPATAQSTKQAAVAKPTTITVTASEWTFKLSKNSNITAGKVTFKVTNKGKIGHDFKVCTKAVTADTANSCKSVGTKVLNPGKSASFTITLKKGKFEFLCDVSGHAKLGMKGLIGVGVALTSKDKAPPVTTNKGTTGVPLPGQGQNGVCTSPKASTFSVTMTEYTYGGMPTTIPCGTITFNLTNIGMLEHNLTVNGQPAGNIIEPGNTGQYTVTLSPGGYSYQCDVGDHAAQGMAGSFTVT